MIAMEGFFLWCAVTPTSARKDCEQYLYTVSALSTRRGKNVKVREKLNRVYLRDRKPPQRGYSTEPGQKWLVR
jgi:hypothetical protein